ncbi:MAG: hypothetical protein DRP06_02445 [Candidatus Aenigmatarchaeota archaeon]|nr:MAG: hypothetical protein DRP06_02445 [Candidatus Aenigmarchaeota archaeon]
MGLSTSDKIIITNKDQITKIEINLNQKVYSPYLKVEQFSTSSIITNATIEFSVNNSWIINNNILIISMLRYNNNWIKLKTEVINQTATQILYKAYTNGFSYFAIAGETELLICNNGETSCSGDLIELCENNNRRIKETCEHRLYQTTITCNLEPVIDQICNNGETKNFMIRFLYINIVKSNN